MPGPSGRRPSQWSAAQMMRIIESAVERASRLPCRYPYRHSSKNAGEDAGMAGWKPALRIERDDWLAMDNGQFLRRARTRTRRLANHFFRRGNGHLLAAAAGLTASTKKT